MKIINLPTTVGGNPQGISIHLQRIGLDSCSWTLIQNNINYPADKVIWSPRDGLFKREIKRLFALRYIFKFDLAFFNYGSGLFSARQETVNERANNLRRAAGLFYSFYSLIFRRAEVGLLRLLNKPIFIQYQGDDARQGDYCQANFAISPATQVPAGYYSATSDNFKREQIKFYANHCFKIYSLNPDLLHVLPANAEFLPYSHISLDEWRPVYSQLDARPLRIGHAPTNRSVKGTSYVLNALDKLSREGLQFELVLIEGYSHAAAKELLKSVDVFVDQLFCGWYGGAAVEAMALGKPVIVYIREDDLRFIPEQMRRDLPVINANADTVESALQTVLQMSRSKLYELAVISRRYVERWHDPIAIAQRIRSDIEQAQRGGR
jgi:glycosyltransferase involved in cell wall biosynthesis